MPNYLEIDKLSQAGKGVTNGYDDSTEREFFIKELPSLFGDPEIEIRRNNEKARCDLSERGPKDWGHVSIFERKYNGLMKYNEQVPVLYIWTDKHMKEMYVLNLRDINPKDYPLQKVYYTAAKIKMGFPNIRDPKAEFKHPRDYHVRIPLEKVHHHIF